MRHSTASCAINLKFGSVPVVEASMSRTISSSASFSLKIRTALTGSPTYFSSLNWTVFTSPSLRSRRQGVMRGLNISELGEVLENPSAVVMTLLRVKLHAEDVPGIHGRREIRAVLGHGTRVLVAVTLEVVGMKKVEPGARIELFEELVAGERTSIIPPHVRHRQIRRRRQRSQR